MTPVPLIDTELFKWIILPLLIFAARVIDVSIGTLRIIYLSRGRQYLAPLLGFLEILIWLLAVRQIFINLHNPVYYLAYAFGFAVGNYVGIIIENKLALGMQVVRIITRLDATNLIEALRQKGFGLTVVDGMGGSGPVKIIFTLIRRKDLSQISQQIRHYNPKAFYSVEDVRMAEAGIFPKKRNRYSDFFHKFRLDRAGK